MIENKRGLALDKAALHARRAAIMAELSPHFVPRRYLLRRCHNTMARRISRTRGEQSTASVDKLVGKHRVPA
jgi:hypothetical protein